jgi:hypothetical protein
MATRQVRITDVVLRHSPRRGNGVVLAAQATPGDVTP